MLVFLREGDQEFNHVLRSYFVFKQTFLISIGIEKLILGTVVIVNTTLDYC